jgi:hypothetical protein
MERGLRHKAGAGARAAGQQVEGGEGDLHDPLKEWGSGGTLVIRELYRDRRDVGIWSCEVFLRAWRGIGSVFHPSSDS